MLAVAATASAQFIDHHNNIQLYCGGGVHSMYYNPVEGIRSPGAGALVGLQYQYMFNHHWGLGFGVEASTLNSSAKYNYSIVNNNIMLPGALYESNVTTTLYNLTEKQHMTDISIPLQVVFRNPVNRTIAFQMGLGLSADIPFKGTYRVTAGTYSRSAYMPRTNETYSDLPSHNLGRYSATSKKIEGNNELPKFYMSLLADLGYTFNCSDAFGIYLGIYGKFGPNNINTRSEIKTPMLDYNDVYTASFGSDRVGNVYAYEAGLKLPSALDWVAIWTGV